MFLSILEGWEQLRIQWLQQTVCVHWVFVKTRGKFQGLASDIG